MIRYPNVKVRLSGVDGNAFAIMGAVSKALRRANVSQEEIRLFRAAATAGDYDALLMTCMNWVKTS